MTGAPELCAIVLSYHNEPTILGALQSLLDQPEPMEIVVVHSGGGATEALLAPLGDRIRVNATARRRLPGEARNAGVEITTAPWVAFLAADCRALPGWAGGRLRRHRAGAAAVASAMAAPAGGTALAAYLPQHGSRMPHRDCGPRRHHGLSYARTLFERFGEFPDLRHGEDTAFNQRLIDAGVAIAWAPDVLTTHAYPDAIPALLADGWRRGRRRAALHRRAGLRARLLAQVCADPLRAFWRGMLPEAPVARRALFASLPPLVAGSVASALGVLCGPASDSQ
jgi:glycosyltransferase involved in cell wall biosynthesis